MSKSAVTGRRPAPATIAGGALVAGVGAALAFAGPVAAVLACAYGGLAVGSLARRDRRLAVARARSATLDLLDGAAADLRAGLPSTTALAGLAATGPLARVHPKWGHRSRRPGADPVVGHAVAAVRLAERTGAPLADLLALVETDARAGDRARASASAQAAGAQTTAWLLTALPAAGLALGQAIGVDPVTVLFDTPIGAGCAVAAIGLQLAGLAWTRRIINPVEAR